MTDQATDSDGLDFQQVFEHELDDVADAQGLNAADDFGRTELRQNLLGLAFSGGGIRSACFNLGVLQGLAKHDLLKQVDYLSTVSGGGYIGGWLSAWLSREAKVPLSPAPALPQKNPAERVFSALSPPAGDPTGDPARVTEPAAIGFLRRYSNYLTPKLGFLSADFWTAIASHFRNTLLNLGILLPALAFVVALPWVLLLATDVLFQQAQPWLVCALALAILILALDRIHRQLDQCSWRDRQIAWRIGCLVLVPAWLLAIFLRATAVPDVVGVFYPGAAPLNGGRLLWPIAGMLGLGIPTIVIRIAAAERRRRSATILKVVEKRGPSITRWMISSVIPGAFVGLLLGSIQAILISDLPANNLPYTAAVGTVLVFTTLILGIVMQIGLLGRELPESIREWWSRAGAWCWILGSLWLFLFAVTLLAPPLLVRAGGALGSLLGASWLSASILGAVLGNSSATGRADASRTLERVVIVMPYVFVLGLIVAAATLNYVVIIDDGAVCIWSTAACSLIESNGYLASFTPDWTNGLGVTQVALVISILLASYAVLTYGMSATLDVNLFSFHAFYRDRLVRCFLGATRLEPRQPNSLTGFDEADDLSLVDLPRRPFHLLNTALNITRSRNLAWQERMAASFTFSRLHCGYHLPDDARGSYQPTEIFGNPDVEQKRLQLQLGTAMTISGAAASPNAGYHTSPVLAFLMTVFNVRLGYWLANPRRSQWWRQGTPRHAGKHLLSELFGLSDADSNFVYLSDGGHFENLGVYELVRRRCRFIVAADAGCDPNFEFEDLGNAIRKCRIDFGIEIDLNVSSIRPDQTGWSKAHCVVGTIRYQDRWPETPNGYLLYIKSSLTGDETEDLNQYRATHPSFPHESTGDQWFSESQFESYRKLGFEIAHAIFKQANKVTSRTEIEAMLLQIRNYWLPESPGTNANFSHHGDALQKIMGAIKADPQLEFLDVQVVPEWPYLMSTINAEETRAEFLWLPKHPQQIRAGYYLCNRVLQLMENVYIDLQLEDYYDHPDNRGWMNLFRHWSWCGMLRATWAIAVSTYGARFQEFCRKHLDLDFEPMRVAEVLFYEYPTARTSVDDETLAQQVEQCASLNFVEHREIISVAGKLRAAGERHSAIKILRVDLPVGIQPLDAGLSFPIAFLMTYLDGNQEWRMAYFRVRDHLRRMGLARQALRKIVEANPEIRGPNPALLTQLVSDEGARFAQEFRSLFKSSGGDLRGSGDPPRT